MVFSFERQGQTCTLMLKGELNIQHAFRLKEALSESLLTSHRLWINVEQVEEIDLSCLQVFCSAHRTAVASEREIMLAGRWSKGFRKVVEDTGYGRAGSCGLPQSASCLWRSGGPT